MKLKEITFCALGIALVFITTMFIKIPAAHGYFNLGDAVIFIFASFLSPLSTFLIGGIGSGLADLSGGFGQYALFTFIIKGLEGLLVTCLLKHKINALLTFIIAGAWMILGYFICDFILYQQLGIASASLVMNLIQALSSIVIAYFFIKKFKKQFI